MDFVRAEGIPTAVISTNQDVALVVIKGIIEYAVKI